MRYTIGCRMIDKNGERIDGFYVFDCYGLPFISPSIADMNSYARKMLVFENLVSAQKYVSYLSNAYYGEFHALAKKNNCDIREYKFFLRKFDSSKLKGLKFERVEIVKGRMFVGYPGAYLYTLV